MQHDLGMTTLSGRSCHVTLPPMFWRVPNPRENMDGEFVLVAREGESPPMPEPSRNYLSEIDDAIESLQTPLASLNTYIHENPELAFGEYKAHDALTEFVREQKGWQVTASAYGIKTAWVAMYDSGKSGPVVSFNAEMGMAAPETQRGVQDTSKGLDMGREYATSLVDGLLGTIRRHFRPTPTVFDVSCLPTSRYAEPSLIRTRCAPQHRARLRPQPHRYSVRRRSSGDRYNHR
jgi:hypothetical protein